MTRFNAITLNITNLLGGTLIVALLAVTTIAPVVQAF